jgi:hypothetical protein
MFARIFRQIRFVPLLASVLLAACGGKILNVGSTDGGGSNSGDGLSSDAAGTYPTYDAGAPDPTEAAASDDGAVTCPPPSSLITPDSASELASAVQGTWQLCTGLETLQALIGADDIVGMWFGPVTSDGYACTGSPEPCLGGDLFYLVQGASGLVRGSGFAYQSTYQITTDGPSVHLGVVDGSGGRWGTSARYSTDPHELVIANIGATTSGGSTMIAVP